jgi:RNA polymerase sigma-70 factor (ECF subfamily)
MGEIGMSQHVNQSQLEDVQAYLESRRLGMIPDPRSCAAWEDFYQLHAPLIRNFVAACRLSEADGNDCIQEVWKDVVGKLREFRYDPERGQFRTWLLVVARRKAADVVRRRLRHPAMSLDEETALPERSPGPAAEHERHRLRTLVQGVLAELSGRVSASSYQILHLHWIEGRPLPEIAAVLGLTSDQVRFRHHRVKQKFRSLFVERTAGRSCLDRSQGDISEREVPKKRGPSRNKPHTSASLPYEGTVDRRLT